MSARWHGVGGWAASLALHGLVVTAAIALLRPAAPPPPIRWEVALAELTATPPPPSPAQAQVRPEPTKAAAPGLRRNFPPPVQPASPPAPGDPIPAEPGPRVVAAPAPTVASPPVMAEADTRVKPAMVSPIQAAAPASAMEKPAAAPKPARPDGEAEGRWRAMLAAKLRELKRYPLSSRRLGQEGVVVLEAHIHPDGRAAANVKQSSGHAALDRAAVRLFEEAMAALAGQLVPRDDSLLEIPVAYRLES